jgi:DNA-binding LacI/PurR family transcriptional regulator
MINGIQVKTKREEVREKVISMIKQNKLRIGDRILSDNQLAKLCKVSPLTANRVLVGMEHEGILSRIKGKGTFIRRNPEKPVSLNALLVMGEEKFSDPEVNINSWHIVKRVHEGLLTEVGNRGKVSTMIWSDENDISMETMHNFEEYDAIFFIGYGRYQKLISSLYEKTILPVVVLGEETTGRDCLNIYTDKAGNTATAVAHLAEHGYRRIGYIGLTPFVTSDKLPGYKKVLEEWGLPVDEKRIVTGIDSQRDGARGASMLYNRGFDCDAVFIDTDLKAIGAIEYFSKVGLRVPEDLAIVSYDGLEPYLSGPPYLTSINIDYGKMINVAFSRIKQHDFVRDKIIGKIAYHSKLKIGRTCGCDQNNQ